MDQATLVNLDVEAGLRVIEALDATHIKVVAALWILFPDYDDWRLVLSSPDIEQFQLLKAYQQVAKALHGRFSSTPPILIMPVTSPFIRELRKRFGKTKNVSGMRLGGQTIGDQYISDAYVYRIQ
jgi:hypothetical protein